MSLAKHPLVLISGLPGTGKTRLALDLARQLRIPVFSKDRFQSQLRQLGLVGREGSLGYRFLFDAAEQQLSLGIGAVLDAVFPGSGYREEGRRMAERTGAAFRAIHCHCSDEALQRSRMQYREQFLPHWSPVGWDEVLRIRDTFVPWGKDQALQLDAAGAFDQNLERALQWVQQA